MCTKLNKLKNLIETRIYYNPNALDYTSERSYGNFDDVFSDGYNCGYANAIEEIKEIIEDIERGGY